MPKEIARAADTAADYQRYGLKADTIQPFEDGMRTNASDQSFEWWYLDATLADGRSAVLTYMTKDPMNFGKELKPWVSFEWTGLDGKTSTYRNDVTATDFQAAKDHCDVQIGQSTLTGDLQTYRVHFEKDDVVADLVFENKLSPWRPGSGVDEFGDHYFAWLPAVPAAKVTGTVQFGDEKVAVTGNGYHDHNWGDESMLKLIHHWYWGRATVGDYQVISADITAAKRYDYTELPVMMIADHGQIISGDAENMAVTGSDVVIDEHTGKSIQKKQAYQLKNGQTEYVLTYEIKQTISGFKMIDQISGVKKWLAKMVGFDGAYLRFTGDISVAKYVDGQLVDQQSKPDGIWELMYFGKNIEKA
ncbi:lipocalin-like domain-containing protein [Leuconostocaceae bacterium ESL0958]|nr:lipocalin-like domain-containing protein [Leuconostocaceae bacterium ESL0958]